jgi:ATP-dependent Lon protease
MGLGPITDIISYTLPFDVEAKLKLLGQPDVDARAAELIQMLESGKIQLHSVSIEEKKIAGHPSLQSVSGKSDDFPPPFSVN